MNNPEQLYNKKSLIDEIYKRHEVKIPWSTLFLFEKRGWLKASHIIQDGKRTRPVYDDGDLQYFVTMLVNMKAVGKTRINLKNIQ